MRFSAKGVVAVGGAVAMVMSMAACGGSNNNASSSDGKLSGEITFQTWNLKNDKYTPYFEDLIAAYEKDNPGTKIKWVDQPSEGYEDKLSADAAAGSLPDVIDMGPNAAYILAKAGTLLNIAQEDPSAKDLYLDNAWKGATFKGEGLEEGTYGFPWYLNTGPTFYNKAAVEACGADASNLPTTYDDFFKLADQIGKTCGEKGISMLAKLPNSENYGEYGVEMMNKDRTSYTFNSDKAQSFIENYKKMYDSGALSKEALNANWNGETDAFKQGKVMAMAGSLYSVNDFKENAPEVYKNLIVTKRLANSSANIFMEMLVVNSQTKNKALAIDFAKYVTNKENQVKFDKLANIFPSTKDSMDDPFFKPEGDDLESQAMRISAEQIETGTLWVPPEFSEAQDTTNLREQVAQAIQGKQSVKDALDSAVKFSDERLQQ
ncbi:ABC transporter substrate-binding protein [Bifidobacterium scaligerum]|uniref:Sugar ABC transporter substrate-binding protein n=1 Tax=Bifidobacterium scaligerum TaxID=2052656 RepID=A0A2M9HS40_9BIFI|nr:sugar ABC transporter substrate-binding protein [Bifidobacterium scaligerum]PJM79623.1 sugar ABC transporter substrate-binding protein [Bifidobacterium scaligerum]